jgi:CxxC motif-containing protein (DUF1111 family)
MKPAVTILVITLSTMLVLGCVFLTASCATPVAPGDPLPGLTRAEAREFERGRLEFDRVFAPETGLGPLFNADSCAECHEEPVSGGPGDEVEVHATAFLPGDICDPLLDVGGPVYQQRVTPALRELLGIDEEPIPTRANSRALRTTPDIFGFGLLDAVPDETILALADPEDHDGNGISGRPNRFIDGRLGRFDRKAFIPTLIDFNAGAFPIEQGVTNPAALQENTIAGAPLPAGADPVPEPEIDGDAVRLADLFVRFLSPPAAQKLTREGKRGRETFSRIGCAACHVPILETGDHTVRALRHKRVAAYTDLLLHDMGPDLADICLGLATPSEFRTEPLMGLHLSDRFLHDGRAESIEEAIRMHGGEAVTSRDLFDDLTDAERRARLVFLGTL